MICDVERQGQKSYCRSHDVLWRPGIEAPAPIRCPVVLARKYVPLPEKTAATFGAPKWNDLSDWLDSR